MRTSSTLGLAVVAGALVAAALFYGRREETIISEARAPVKTITSGITSGTVERIDIEVPGETSTTLTKQDGLWYTNVQRKHRADKGAINGIFTALEKEIEGEVVSSDPESYADYQVNETSGTRVRLFEAGKTQPSYDFIIGKDAGAAFTTYMREAEGKDVINARASLSFTFKRPEGWRDKQILEFPQDAVTRVAAEGTSSTFEVAKNEAGTWKVLKPDLGDAQPTKVNPMVSMASTLRANEFVETTQSLAELGLDPPRQKLTITYDDKATSPPTPKTAILLIGDKKNEGQYYAKRADAEDVYTVGEYMATTFAPEVNSLALTPPKAPEPETTATATQTTDTTSMETTSTLSETTGNVSLATETTETAPAAATPVATPESTPAATPAPTPEPTPVATPAPTPEPTPVATPAPTPEPTPVATPATTPEPTPVATPATTPEPTPVATPAATPTPTATPAPTPEPTPVATPAATPSSTPATETTTTTESSMSTPSTSAAATETTATQ